jgi:hypothetical protein
MERIGSAIFHGAGEAIHPCLACFEDVRVQCSNCLVTTITIELDLSGRRGVCLVPERERTAHDYSRSNHRKPRHHRHLEPTAPLRPLSNGRVGDETILGTTGQTLGPARADPLAGATQGFSSRSNPFHWRPSPGPSSGAGMVIYEASSSMTRPARPGSPQRTAPKPTKAGCRSPQPFRARTQKTRPWVPRCLQDLSRRSRRKGRSQPRV